MEQEVQAEYPDWEVIGFEKGKLTLYKEFEDVCGQHFKLKIEDGKVVIYIVNNDGTESVYEKTNISSEYLTETDLLNMQEGLEIYGVEELNQIIEDFLNTALKNNITVVSKAKCNYKFCASVDKFNLSTEAFFIFY